MKDYSEGHWCHERYISAISQAVRDSDIVTMYK